MGSPCSPEPGPGSMTPVPYLFIGPARSVQDRLWSPRGVQQTFPLSLNLERRGPGGGASRVGVACISVKNWARWVVQDRAPSHSWGVTQSPLGRLAGWIHWTL